MSLSQLPHSKVACLLFSFFLSFFSSSSSSSPSSSLLFLSLSSVVLLFFGGTIATILLLLSFIFSLFNFLRALQHFSLPSTNVLTHTYTHVLCLYSHNTLVNTCSLDAIMALLKHCVDSLLLSITLVSLALITELVHAQSLFSPIPTGGSASVFIEGKAFYIQSGLTTTGVLTQTFSINLRSSWNTSNVPYTKLPDGLFDSQFPNTLLDDGVSWLAVNNKAWVTYSLTTGAITPRAPLNTYTGFVGLSAVLDRGAGEVVIPNGNAISAQTSSTLFITPFNLSTRADSQPELPNGLTQYSLAWSQSAQKVTLFGGKSATGFSASLYQRNSSPAVSWYPVTTAGGPSARESPCMVPAFNGDKLILFGGSNAIGAPLSDIYIFDVAKSAWTQGPDGGSGYARSSHACAMSGDALIVWGGFSNIPTRSPPPNLIAIFNLTINQWVTTYNAVTIKPVPTSTLISSSSTPRPTSTTNSGSGSGNGNGNGNGNGTATNPDQDTSGSGSGSGNNTGAIAGGVSAAVVALLVGLGFVFWRRNRLKKDMNLSNDHHQQSEVRSPDYKEPVEKNKDPQGRLSVYPIPPPVNSSRHPQLNIPQQINEGVYDHRDPVERNRDPHAYPCVPPPPVPLQPPNSAQHIQQKLSQREHRQYNDYKDPVDRNKDPQANLNVKTAPPIPPRPARGSQHSQTGTRRERHRRHQSSEEYDYSDPIEKKRDPNGEFNTGPTPRVVLRTVRSANARHPQLDVARRKQELALEMQLLEDAAGNASPSVQHTDRWSINRSGSSGSPHTVTYDDSSVYRQQYPHP